MNRTEFLSSLDVILELKPGTLKGGETLRHFDWWDSLAMVSFIALADEKLGVILEAKQVADCRTVDELIYLVQDGVSAAESEAAS